MSPVTLTPAHVDSGLEGSGTRLRLRRMNLRGPRCPDCAGPLVFGEGCHVCPVCGYSGCESAR